jgi:hypothetical protein
MANKQYVVQIGAGFLQVFRFGSLIGVANHRFMDPVNAD